MHKCRQIIHHILEDLLDKVGVRPQFCKEEAREELLRRELLQLSRNEEVHIEEEFENDYKPALSRKKHKK